MKTAIAITLAMATPAAAATECAAGHTHKEDLTNKFCNSGATDAADCDGECCQADKSTCGGVGLTCNFGSYHANTDAWKNTKTTAYDFATKANKPDAQDKFQAECCKPVSTCASTAFTCPGGMARKASGTVSGIHCPAGPESCATKTCCEDDKSTCGGYFELNHVGWSGNICVLGMFPRSATDAIRHDAAWKAVRSTNGKAFANQAAWNLVCCEVAPTCASKGYACPSGMVRDPTKNGANSCARDANKEYSIEGCSTAGSLCCTAADGSSKTVNGKSQDLPTTCGGAKGSVSCMANMYQPKTDTWFNKVITKGQQNDQCCAPKATCAVAKCPAGYKKKLNVDALSCPSDRDSCATGTTCCELDTTTCGGLEASISCPYGFYNEATFFTAKTSQATKDAWKSRAATQATRNTACCTARQACENGLTTTPAPAAITTTPAAPMRLYSAHKVASTKHDATNFVWLAAGAAMGMAVLMGVQRLRSRATAYESIQ